MNKIKNIQPLGVHSTSTATREKGRKRVGQKNPIMLEREEESET
jgi:hypothetical protein